MAPELFLEIGTEEIPAGFLTRACADMERRMAERLAALGLGHGPIRATATPRRLVLAVADLAEHQASRREEAVGPPRQAAFDATGQPTRAAIGFARSQGVPVDALTIVTTPRGEYVQVVKDVPGAATASLLPGLLPAFIQGLPFPKSMRWGSGSLAFARPIRWLVALYDGRLVPFTLDGLAAGDSTCGHRFMAPQPLLVTGSDHHRQVLREAHVLVDMAERRQRLQDEIEEAAAAVGGRLLPDEELAATVANLVEIPFAVAGSFDPKFLSLPRSVLVTAMREHQKSFAVVSQAGDLLPFFVAVNNTRVRETAVSVQGHQRVLRARLEDALFFFNEDQKLPLADRVPGLAGVIFQARLGTMLEKSQRLVQLAGSLAQALAPDLRPQVERAAHLAKADLLTAMV
ncbi:MAG: glycine--tRNA ligase subunit beta, partial [Thermodesulfobacteriota bacterium]